jgi:hypothetical protein
MKNYISCFFKLKNFISIFSALFLFFLFATLNAQTMPEEKKHSDFKIYLRLGGEIGFSYELQGSRSVTEADSSSTTGTSTTNKAYPIYSAKDNGNGISCDAGFMWNPDLGFGKWMDRSFIMAGGAAHYRYISSSESNMQAFGLILDTTLFWIGEFYVGGAYASFASPMTYVSDWNGENPVLDKKKLSGFGVIIGGGLDVPVYKNFGAYLLFDYFVVMGVDGKTNEEYEDFSWARTTMRLGVTYKFDI